MATVLLRFRHPCWAAGRPTTPGFLRGLGQRGTPRPGSKPSGGGQSSGARPQIHCPQALLKDLGEQLAGPIVSSWVRAVKWHGKPTREALPLPLFVVCQLEQAASSGPLEDRFLVAVQTLDAMIRGWVWRSKTGPTGVAWGCWDCGATGLNWGRGFGSARSLPETRFSFI